MRWLIVTLFVTGCTYAETIVVHVSDGGADADAAPAPVCSCELQWVRIVDASEAPVRCDPRGECDQGASCEVVAPTSDEPSCMLR